MARKENENNLIDRVRVVIARMVENRESVAERFKKIGDELNTAEQLTEATQLRAVYMLLTSPETLEQFEAIYGIEKEGK